VLVIGALRRRLNLLSGEANENHFGDKHFGRKFPPWPTARML
jgi:hypothetical protein